QKAPNRVLPQQCHAECILLTDRLANREYGVDDDKRITDTLWPLRHKDAASVGHRALLVAQPAENLEMVYKAQEISTLSIVEKKDLVELPFCHKDLSGAGTSRGGGGGGRGAAVYVSLNCTACCARLPLQREVQSRNLTKGEEAEDVVKYLHELRELQGAASSHVHTCFLRRLLHTTGPAVINGPSDPENCANPQTPRNKEENHGLRGSVSVHHPCKSQYCASNTMLLTTCRFQDGSGQSAEKTSTNGAGCGSAKRVRVGLSAELCAACAACASAKWLTDASKEINIPEAKEKQASKCKLRFPNVSTEEFTEWRETKRSIWPCPKGGFKDAAVTVFWDIENCLPNPDIGSSPGAYASMFRTAFKTITGARIMTCIATLSSTYPVRDGQLSYEKQKAPNRVLPQQCHAECILLTDRLANREYGVDDDKRITDTLWPLRHKDAASVGHRALLVAQPAENLEMVYKAQEISTLSIVEKKDLVELPFCHKDLSGAGTSRGGGGGGRGAGNAHWHRDHCSILFTPCIWCLVIINLLRTTATAERGAEQKSHKGGRGGGRGQAKWLTDASKEINIPEAKEKQASKCKLRFPNVSTEEFTEWRETKRSIWPCPKGGFKDAAVTVFWDIENCLPNPDIGSSPGAYASMFRTAFKTITGARIMTCIATLSSTYPVRDGQLSYEKHRALLVAQPAENLEMVYKAQEISTLSIVEKKDLVELPFCHKDLSGAGTIINGPSDPENCANPQTPRNKEENHELRGSDGGGQSAEKTSTNGAGRGSDKPDWLNNASKEIDILKAKEKQASKCKLRFPNVSTEEFTEWRETKRSIWPCPKGGFKDAAVTVFWDIENCPPDSKFGQSPGAYASMFRTAFETTTGARTMTCIASLSGTYPVRDGQLSYEKLLSLNSLDEAWFVLTAPGKTSKKVHKDHKEADDVLKSKMQECLRVCKPGDVVVIISGDGGYASLCHNFDQQDVKVIVIGPTVGSTNQELMQAIGMWMDWEKFCAGHAEQ
ncbi:hypothetical protein QJQ45_023671, partial [Haematococcus lacustris]